MTTPCAIRIDGDSLTFEDVWAVAVEGATVTLAEAAHHKIQASRALVDKIVASDEVVYSINTGFGALSRVTINAADVETLQLNFVRSHAVGTGEALPEHIVRAMLLLRANTLAKGYSGVRMELIERLLVFLNLGIHPVVPSQGSLGASGDLAPLAHMALPLIGEGEVNFKGRLFTAERALAEAGLMPLVLKAKEGLALTNGTQMMTAIGVLTLLESEKLASIADLSACMSLEGFRGSHLPFSALVHNVRPHPGQIASAAHCRALLVGSDIADSHVACKKVQDPYSFRCTPQVHGAVRDTLTYVRQVLAIEMNASTDNPLLFAEEGLAISQGNFHGEPVAMAMDYLGIAMSELGNISERRIDKLNDPAFSELPAFLTAGPEGLNSGTMMAQYTAASLVAENKILAHPASVDSIPSSNNKEDHVSLGSIAARKARDIVRQTRYVLATEVYCAVHALHALQPMR